MLKLARPLAAAILALSLTPVAASADFRLCNVTASRVGVAVGYRDGKNWVSEGWWNIPSSNCETLLKGPLVSRYYYVYALDYDHGGEWGGKSFMCTRSHEFTIRGIERCRARGFDRTGFFEIDTGDQRSWIVQLTEVKGTVPANGETAAAHPGAAPLDAAMTGRSAAAKPAGSTKPAESAQAETKPATKKPAQ